MAKKVIEIPAVEILLRMEDAIWLMEKMAMRDEVESDRVWQALQDADVKEDN